MVSALRTTALLVLGLATVTSGAAADTETFTVVAPRSSVVIDVHKSGVFSPVLHDHHFHTRQWRGSFTFDPAHPERVRGELVFDAASLRDEQPKLSEEDLRKVNAQAQGPEVLDAARYPTIRLSFDRMEILERGEQNVRGHLVGLLTLHGQTHPIRVPIAATYRADALHAVGATAFRQSDFGIKPYSTALGTIGVEDRVDVHVDLVATVTGGGGPD